MPLLHHGIASMIIMAPYNGTRSPHGQDGHYIDNVADYMLQSLAIIHEVAALIRTLDHGIDGPRPNERLGKRANHTLGVVGLSWGGAMAACASLVSQRPVACMVGLGSDSPKVMATGALNWQLDWEMLQNGGGEVAVNGSRNGTKGASVYPKRLTRSEAEAQIVKVFTRITFATLVDVAPIPQSIGSCVQVVARDDHYVSAEEGIQLHDSLRKAVLPDCTLCSLRWVDGGHATSFVRQTAIFVPAIVDAIDAVARGKQSVDTAAAAEKRGVNKTLDTRATKMRRVMMYVVACIATAVVVQALLYRE